MQEPKDQKPFPVAAKRQKLTCAWSLRASCAGRPSEPWLPRHAWREFGRTHSSAIVSSLRVLRARNVTHSFILDLLRLAALERKPVPLVLEALGRNQPLDLGSLGIDLLALALGLDLSANDILADLFDATEVVISHLHRCSTHCEYFMCMPPPRVTPRR